MDPTDRKERLCAALTYLRAEAWARAEAACRPLACDLGDVEALLLLGLAVAAQGQTARAAPVLDHVARNRPNAVHPCKELAQLSPPLPRERVAAQFRACLRLSPGDTRLRRAYAEFLLDQREPKEAATILWDALDTAAGQHLMGLAQAEQGCFREAIHCFRAAVTLDPGPAMGWSNLGMMLKIEGQFDDAITAHDGAVQRAPDDVRLRVNRAVALLHAGRWAEAWNDYEWRLRLAGSLAMPQDRLLPTLDPGSRLDGKTVLAVHEDGFGDTLQFMRYLPLLAARGARVFVAVPGPLIRVLGWLPGLAGVLGPDDPVPPHDFCCPMFSLPRVFETTPTSVPPAPYLSAEPDLVSTWSGGIPSDGLRVGLVWAGQARPWLADFETLDRRRSTDLATLAPFGSVPATRFISLQTGPAASQAASPPHGMTIIDPMTAVRDFADTAAIISSLDVVISVDTSVVHLAGAMGKRVFLLDRYDNCWRWLSRRADSPWYSNLTIFRQAEPGDWSEPVARAAAALEAMALFRGQPERDRQSSSRRALADAA
jgi:Flp pilus assembly protein TadD